MLRHLYSIGLVILLLTGPWWLFLAIAGIGYFLWSRYYEGLAAVLVYDCLFSLPDGGLWGSQFFFSTLFLVAFVVIERYKANLISFQRFSSGQ